MHKWSDIFKQQHERVYRRSIFLVEKADDIVKVTQYLRPSLMRSISGRDRFMAGRSVSMALFRSAWALERRASNDIVLIVAE